MHRRAALAVAALLAMPASAQLLGESGCLYLSGSTMCPGFSSSYVAVYDMSSVGQFFNSVSDVTSWDLAFQNYMNSSTNGSGFRRSKFNNDLSCSDAVDTDATIRWQQTYMCAQFVGDQSSIDCRMTYLGTSTQQTICSSTCDEFSESEQEITSNRSLCSGRSASQITQDLNTCNSFASSGSSCVSGEQNERNCGFGNWTEQLCDFCNDNSGDSCCSSADLSVCNFEGSSTSRSGSTSSTGGSTGAAGNRGSSKSGISGGAIAGIVIGVIGGLLVLGALLFFFCRRRRNNRSPSGQDGHVLMKSTDEFPATPQLSESAHSGMEAEKTNDVSAMHNAVPAAAGVGAGAVAGASAAGLGGAHANRNANATTRNAGADFSTPQTDFSANSQASTLTPTNRADPGMGGNSGYSVSPGPSPAPTGSTGSGHLGSNNNHRGAEAAAAAGAAAVGAAALHHHNNKKLPNEPSVTSGTGAATSNFAPGSHQGHSPTRAAHVPGTGSGVGVAGPNFAASPTSPGRPTYSSHGHGSGVPSAPGSNFASNVPGSNFAANTPHSGSAPIYATHASGRSPSHSSHHGGAVAAGAAGVAGAAALGAAAARSGRSGHSDGRNLQPTGPTTPPATSSPAQPPTPQAHAAGTASPVAVTAPSSPMIDAAPSPSGSPAAPPPAAPKAIQTPPQAPSSAAPAAAAAAAPAAAAVTSTTPASALLPSIQDASGAWIRPGSTVSVIHPYPASLSDELSLQPGMRILVHELFNDGWANGTVSASAADGSPQGRRGQFPAVCVAADAA